MSEQSTVKEICADIKRCDINKYNCKMNGIEGKTPFLIGVAGGTSSGKSTVCKRIMEKLGQVDMDHTERQVVCISQDSFYRELTPAEKLKAVKGQFNFDHPDAFNNDLILKTLQDILLGKKCEVTSYDYRNNSLATDEVTTIYPADVVLFEGILVFYFQEIRDLFHMKLFVDTDSDTRLARRVPRDIKERGRDLDQVLNQYMNFVKPAFEEFCSPTKKFADVIIPRGADNTVAIDLIVHHIWDILHGTQRVHTQRRVSTGSDTLIAIDLIVQHIRDFLNNRKHEEPPVPVPIPETPSPGRSPSHNPARRLNSGEGGQFMRPH